jgi:adenylyltransferase/sulfurtransferase
MPRSGSVSLISAAAQQFQGQVAVPGPACYRCFVGDAFDADDCDTCAELGVLGALTGTIAISRATRIR